jgi:hypothetical protein
MACSIPSREPSKKGTEALCLWFHVGTGAHGNRQSHRWVDGFGPIKGPNDSWVGLAPYWLTSPTYGEKGEQFETFHKRCEQTHGARRLEEARGTRNSQHAPGPGQRKPRTPPTDTSHHPRSRAGRRRAQACGARRSRAGPGIGARQPLWVSGYAMGLRTRTWRGRRTSPCNAPTLPCVSPHMGQDTRAHKGSRTHRSHRRTSQPPSKLSSKPTNTQPARQRDDRSRGQYPEEAAALAFFRVPRIEGETREEEVVAHSSHAFLRHHASAP